MGCHALLQWTQEMLLHLLHWQAGFFTTEAPGKVPNKLLVLKALPEGLFLGKSNLRHWPTSQPDCELSEAKH